MSFDDILGGQSLMGILRGLPPQRAVELAHRIWDAGVDLVEVPVQPPDGEAALRAVVAAGQDRGKPVGAGTVLTPQQARAAAAAGAQYTVAPGLDLTVLAASLGAGLPHLPGVGSATEVQHARAAGCRWLKAFPAKALGVDWLRAMRGPFPDVAFVATGGLGIADVEEFLAAGARLVALGTALADPAQIPELTIVLAQVAERSRR